MFVDITLPYESEALAADIILIFILTGLEAVRIFLGMHSRFFHR